MINFSPANNKLRKLERKTNKKIYSFDILSGVNCPFAKECHSWAIKKNGSRKIQDGPHCKYRCYSASQEVTFPDTYEYRKKNSRILKLTKQEIIDIILDHLPEDAGIIRIHASGDFNSQRYFDAWLEIAKQNPKVIFYCYTKALPYWIKRKEQIPKNFVLTASYGGTHDHLIQLHKLRSVRVVLEENTRDPVSHRILPIDRNDSIAYNPRWRRKNFTLLIHGIQPAGTLAGKASYKNRTGDWK